MARRFHPDVVISANTPLGAQAMLAEEIGVAVRILPDWHLKEFVRPDGRVNIRFEDFLGIPTLALDHTPPAKSALLIKAGIDYALAGALMIPGLPLFAVIAAAIKIASPGGPVFYRWMKMDLAYIDNWSLGLDFKILARTALVVLLGYGR